MQRPRLLLVTAFAGLAVLGAQAQAPDPRGALAGRAATRVHALQREADRLASQSQTLLGDLRQLELQRQIGRETLAAANEDLEHANLALADARDRVTALEAQRVAAAPALAAELVELYKRGRRRQVHVLLANAADSRALGRLVRGVALLANAERLQLDRHRQTLQAGRDAAGALEQQVLAAAAARDAQVAAEAELARTVAERNRLIDAIDRERDVAARYAGELQAAQVALERFGTGSTGSADSAASAALPIEPFKGDLPWPVRGVLRAGFAPGNLSGPGRAAPAVVRNGIEVTATEGSPVTIVHGGRVSYAAPFVGLGTLVVVDHGQGVQSLYGHLAQLTVAAGDVLERGARVGQVGLAPAGRPLLYFELRVDGRPVDPLQWLRSSP